MVIDLTSLCLGNIDELFFDEDVNFDDSWLENTSIRKLCDVHFKGSVIRLSDNDYQITGVLSGKMILPDDITLEDVIYPYQIDIDEDFNECDNENHLKIVQNKLDVLEFLWQNILVEIPSKIRNEKNVGLTLEGDGWRLITEDDVKSNNSPLSELGKMFNSGKE